jgi:hypothetical protein
MSINNKKNPDTIHLVAKNHSFSRHIIVIWLGGMLVFLPVKVFQFPSNLELVDLWVVLALPFFWLSFILGDRTRISMAYTFPILLILIGSFASTIAAPNATRSLIVILKEIYLFVWFMTLATLISSLDTKDLRRILYIWLGVVVLHGLLIIAQFLLPEIWRITTSFAGQQTAYVHFRPSGLFISEKAGDANKAAFFQLLGFVPLILAKPSKRIAIISAVVIFSSLLATGSMGTTTAFLVGLVTAIFTISIFDRKLIFIKKYLVRIVIAVSLLIGLFSIVLSQNQGYKEHFQKIIAGRAEKSSGGRFGLWQRGLDVFIEHNVYIWGVGPENFREVDPSGNDNQLHNDLLAFTIERGLIATIGLILFAIVAVSKAVQLLLMYRSRYPQNIGLIAVIFLAIFAAMLFVSITHQIFHARELWLVLALQEAVVFNVKELA